MKKKRTILGVLLTLMLLGSFVVGAAPVSAGTLNWSDIDIPDSSGKKVVSGTDITDMAVASDGETIWVVDGQDDSLYKSTNAGESWSGKSGPDDASELQLIAIAPDDEDIIILVADDTEVYISTNGGDSWGALDDLYDLGVDMINDVAISSESSGSHYITVACDDGAYAEVWSWEYGATTPDWDEISDDDGMEADGANTTAAALAFSPNFPGDQVLLVVTADFDADDVNLEVYSYNQDKWNDEAGFDGYAAPIVSSTTMTGVTSASMSLDPEYLGSDDSMRIVFVGLTLAGDSDSSGIYRMDDTSDDALKDEVEIHSVAFDGTNLVAGRYDSNIVYRSDEPLDSDPSVSTATSLKRPAIDTSGEDEMTVVAWAGDKVVAGTSGNESAFAISENMGKTFNDVSLIDTELYSLNDFIITPDGSTMYLVSDDEDDLSVWRSASDWVRVLAVEDEYGYIIRMAPDDADVVYLAEKGSTVIYYSADGGLERWQTRAGRYETQDLAVEGDGDVLYVLIEDNGDVSKSSNSGFTWGSSEGTGLDSGNMLVSLGEDMLIAGSMDGYVSYSDDGNDSWEDISDQLQSDYAVQVCASGLADGDYIYASTNDEDAHIERWQIGDSDDWKNLETLDEDYEVYGIDIIDGTLYAIASNGDDSRLYRSISPNGDSVSFDVITEEDVDFDQTPQALRSSMGSTKLYAIDTDDDDVYSFTDTLAATAPPLVSPKQDFTVKTNPITGRSVMVSFVWESPSDNVEAFNLEIAFDNSFDEVVLSETVEEDGDEGDTITQLVGPYGPEDFELEWTFDTDYFWRVRVAGNSPAKSPWSEVRRFSIEDAATQPPVNVEIPPAPEIIVEVPPPTQVNIPPAPTPPPAPAPIAPAWIWAVVIIGALLFIVLIIFIVRTRRPV